MKPPLAFRRIRNPALCSPSMNTASFSNRRRVIPFGFARLCMSKRWSAMRPPKTGADSSNSAMPTSLLKGGSDALRGELLRLGLEIAPSARAHRLLVEYLMRIQPSDRARCVQHTGWYRNAFVLPQDTLGTLDEIVLYQTHHPTPAYTQAGSLEDWQQHVACLCIGNSRLILAVSAAFAAPLIHLIGAESGGLHFVGASSSGKTTALRVAASGYGTRDTVCHWRATLNGLEAVASLHSDTLLILDELAQIDPKEAGEVAYLLANGRGKTRAGPAGKTRLSQDWRLLFLSA